MRRYLLVRHAEPVGRGAGDELSNAGRAQAAALARRLDGWEIDEAWSSDLPRARETAAILLAGREAPRLHTSAALREVELPPDVASMGPGSAAHAAWERDALASLAGGLSDWIAGLTEPRRHEGTKGTGGRGDWEIGRRGEEGSVILSEAKDLPGTAGEMLRSAQHDIAGPAPHHSSLSTHHWSVLVVSHAGPLRALLCLLLGLPPERHWTFRLDQASLTIVERGDDMGTLTLLNDRCHLERQEGPTTEMRRRL